MKPKVPRETRERIENFTRELVALCAKWGVDLDGEECDQVAIIDTTRVHPDGWPRDAFFSGIDKDGIYSYSGFTTTISGPIFEDYEGFRE